MTLTTISNLGPRYHVLVVDDSALSRKMLIKTLTAIGHTCDEAEDGQMAVNKVKENGLTTYNVILMDFIMVCRSFFCFFLFARSSTIPTFVLISSHLFISF